MRQTYTTSRRAGWGRLRRIALALAVALTSDGVRAGGTDSPEAVYTCSPKADVTFRIVKGKEEGQFTGSILHAPSAAKGEPAPRGVLELRQVGERGFQGRCRADLLKLPAEAGEWVEVAKAELLDDGNLRCTVRLAAGAVVEVVFERVREVEAAPPPKELPAQDTTELAGAWQHPHGGVTHFVSFKESYVGQIAKLSPLLEEYGFRVGEETVRAQRTAAGVYQGTMKVKSAGGKKTWWEDVTLTVRGDRLESVRRRKGGDGEVRETATRLASRGDMPGGEVAPARDEGDLTGAWRDAFGGVVRYTRNAGNDYVGHIVKLSPRNEGFGFRVGEEGVRLKRTGQFSYKGQVLAKTEGGGEAWWETLEATVQQDRLKYVRHMRGGGIEENAATRLAEEEPQP